MPSLPPPIFDRALQRRRLTRAIAAGPATFLLDWAVTEIFERLATVKRRFTSIADIGTPLPGLARALAERDAAASVVRLAPVMESCGAAVDHNGFGSNRSKTMNVIDSRDLRESRGKPGATFSHPALALALVGDEEALPFGPETFDLAVSALSLHQLNDLPGALVQIRRSLAPDGLFLGAMLGGRTLEELRQCLALAEAEVSGGGSPHVAPFADVRDMGGLLQRAGFALPVADLEPLTVRYANLFALMADLRAMGATNTLILRAHQPATRRMFWRAAEFYAERFSDADGRVRATFEVIFLSGWAPHESQQKPLPPGSARMSLADALKPKDAASK